MKKQKNQIKEECNIGYPINSVDWSFIIDLDNNINYFHDFFLDHKKSGREVKSQENKNCFETNLKRNSEDMKTLQDYKTDLAMRHRNENTRRYYFNTIKQLLDDTNKTVETLTKKDIDEWIAKQNTKLNHNTLNNYRIRINIFLKWLNKPEWKLKIIGWKQTNRHILELEQIIELKQIAKKLSPEHNLIITLITDTNARPSEICDLKLSNIQSNKIYFDDTKTGNNYGFITPDLMKAIYEYQKVRPKPLAEFEDYILIGAKGRYKGRRYSRKATRIRTVIKEIQSKANITNKITPYDLRASVGTQEFNQCVNPKTIQRKFRHRNLRTTMTYNHIDDKMVEEYANSGTIFNKQSLLPSKRKKAVIIDSVFNCYPSQELNNIAEGDNISFDWSLSVSFSFLENIFCDIEVLKCNLNI